MKKIKTNFLKLKITPVYQIFVINKFETGLRGTAPITISDATISNTTSNQTGGLI